MAGDFLSDFEGRGRRDNVHRQSANGRLHVADVRRDFAACKQDALIADLPAGLGIEGCSVEHQLRLGIGSNLIDRLLVDQQSNDLRLGRFEIAVALELGGLFFPQLLVDRRDGRLVAALPTRAGASTLRTHLLFKTGMIDGQVALARHLLLLVEREAEGVIQLERGRSRQHAFVELFGFRLKHLFGQCEAVLVTRLLFFDDARDALHRIHHFRIAGLHVLGDEAGQVVEKWRISTGETGVTECATNDLAQHISASLIGGQNVVVNEKRGGAAVVRDDAKRRVVLSVFAEGNARRESQRRGR